MATNQPAPPTLNNTTVPAVVKKDTVPSKPVANTPTGNNLNRDSGYVESMDDTTIISKKIRYNLYTFHPVTLSEPFRKDSALAKLYPGHYYKLRRSKTDSVVFEAWSCKACPVHNFENNTEDDWNEIFPIPDNNETQIKDTILFIDKAGKRSIIISFETTEFEEDFVGMGNGSGAFMGLALFTEENNGWQLKAFNPAVGLYGSYQEIPDIHPFRFSKDNIGCYIGEILQGAGSPAYIIADVFGVFDSTFKSILVRKNACRGNRDRNIWDAVISIDSTAVSNGFPDLIFTTDGDYSSTYIDPMDDENDAAEVALKQIKPYIKHKTNFDFTIKSRYTFTGSQYKMVNEDVTTMPHRKSNIPKGLTKYYWGKVAAGKFSRLDKE